MVHVAVSKPPNGSKLTGLKPHAQVKDEMDRFMREVASSFEGKHRLRRAA